MMIAAFVAAAIFGATWCAVQAAGAWSATRRMWVRPRDAAASVSPMGRLIACGGGPARAFAPIVGRWLSPRRRAQLAGMLERAGFLDFCPPELWLAYCILFGPVLPLLWLWQSRRHRCRAIRATFPLLTDLLALALDAGAEFTGALRRVVAHAPSGPLRAEWERVLDAIALGLPRAEALRHMARRIGLPEVAALTAALIQADRLGAPLAKTFQALVEQVRFDRFQRAERAGAMASQKVLLPVVCCILPAFLLLVLGGVVLGLAVTGVPGGP